MNRRGLINQLELAYSPISNYDFCFLKNESIIQDLLRSSSLYVICQRPIISFENILLNEEDSSITFEIHQNNNSKKLICNLPFFQENIAIDKDKCVFVKLGSINKNNKYDKLPFNDVHGMQFFEGELEDAKFLIWFTPEKFLQNYWKGLVKANIKGNIRDFLNYWVHYVGKSTDQDIWDRLTGHETLQEILSLEYPLNYGALPTHEIVLLFFEFYDNLSISTFGDSSSTEDMVNAILGKDRPNEKTIFLDAEKALIKAMQPKYNKILFKNYPVSRDGLQKYKYNSYSYTFMDPITLTYAHGQIQGGLNAFGGDTIIITDNKNMEVIKN